MASKDLGKLCWKTGIKVLSFGRKYILKLFEIRRRKIIFIEGNEIHYIYLFIYLTESKLWIIKEKQGKGVIPRKLI